MPCHIATFLQFRCIFLAHVNYTCMMPHTHKPHFSCQRFKKKNFNQSACFELILQMKRISALPRVMTQQNANYKKKLFLLCNAYPSTSCYLLVLSCTQVRLVCCYSRLQNVYMQSGKNIVASCCR